MLVSVNIHIQPEYKEVLVIDRFDVRMDEGAEGLSVVGKIVGIGPVHLVGPMHALNFYHPRKFDVYIDGAVLLKAPGKSVVIIFDGCIILDGQVRGTLRYRTMSP